MKILMILPRVFFKNTPISQVEMPLIKALESEGLKIDIITSDQHKDSDGCAGRIYYIHELKLMCLFNRFLEKFKWDHLLFLPDYLRFSWNPFVKCKIKKIINEGQYDFIHTASFPSSTHLLGMYIKTKYSIPWIASFYDPWYMNPHRMPLTRYGKNKNRKMERNVALKADIIFHTNDIIIGRWEERYRELVQGRIFALPIVANSLGDQDKYTKEESKIVISHIGNLYGKRSATSFIEALSKLKNEASEVYAKFQVNLVGNVWQKDMDLIHKLGLEDAINCPGMLSEKECNQYYFQSDILLVIDGDFCDNIFFPSKLVKYYYSRKPILGLTTKGSVLEDEMIKSRHIHIPKDSVNEIFEYLVNVSRGLSFINDYDTKYCERYNPTNVAKFYYNMLLSIKAK